MNQDISNIADIRVLVDKFYQRAGSDELLAPIFARIPESDAVRETLYEYWINVLLNASFSDQQQFPRHIEQMFSRRHFIRWLNLFLDTIDTLYHGERADKAKVIIIRKSEEFQSKLALSRF